MVGIRGETGSIPTACEVLQTALAWSCRVKGSDKSGEKDSGCLLKAGSASCPNSQLQLRMTFTCLNDGGRRREGESKEEYCFVASEKAAELKLQCLSIVLLVHNPSIWSLHLWPRSCYNES